MSVHPITAQQAPIYKTPTFWVERAPRIVVVGAGGNGSEVVDALASFHHALRSLGHPEGLAVTVIDDAIVRESNLVRQRFWPCDLGQFKAISLVNRYNLMLGTSWEAMPFRFPSYETVAAMRAADLIISAVDLPSARRAIASSNLLSRHCMWLDLGNEARHGQVVFGAAHADKRSIYPNVIDAYPEIETLEDDTKKSCSVAEAIRSQDCLVNRSVTTAGMNIVWELLRTGETDKHWITVDLASGNHNAFPFPEALPSA